MKPMRLVAMMTPILALALWRCWSEEGPLPLTSPFDAGSPIDNGRDGSSSGSIRKDATAADANSEDAVAFDAAPGDGGTPRSPLLQYGTWKLIPGINNPNCLIAENAAAAVPPLEWQACANNRAGCKKLKKTWTNKPGAGIGFGGNAEPRAVRIGGKPHLLHQMGAPEGYGVDDGEYLNVVRGLDGITVAATFHTEKGTNSCVARGLSTDGKTVAYAGFQRPPPATSGPRTPFVLNFAAGGFSVSPRTQDGVPTFGGFIGTSTDRTFHQLTGGGFGIFNPSTNAWVQKDGEVAIAPFEAPMGVVGGAIGTHGGVPVGITYTDNSGNWVRVTSPAGEHYTTGFALDRDNQNRMYWIESDSFSGPPTSSILYTAPFAKTAAELAAAGGPKRLTNLGGLNGRGGTDMIANAGLAVDLFAWDTAFVVRGSDGKGWTIPAEPGEYFAQGIWVDDNEVWLATAVVPPGSTPAQGIFFDGILVIQRSSLGAPTLMPKP
jgi:hypothetical protein